MCGILKVKIFRSTCQEELDFPQDSAGEYNRAPDLSAYAALRDIA